MSENREIKRMKTVIDGPPVFCFFSYCNVWFISLLLVYLNKKAILSFDSAICNKSVRKKWLECLALAQDKTFHDTIQRELYDGTSEWCTKRRLSFTYLHLYQSESESLDFHQKELSEKGLISLLSNNPDLTDIKIDNFGIYTDVSLFAMAAHCHKLLRIHFSCIDITDIGIHALVSMNRGLKDIELLYCWCLSPDCLKTISKYCFKLRRIVVKQGKRDVYSCTDEGIEALVSSNNELEEIELDCNELSDTSLLSIAHNCFKLRKIVFYASFYSEDGIEALIANNQGLEDIRIQNMGLTDSTLQTIADNCSRLRRIEFRHCHFYTDKGIAELICKNHYLEVIKFNKIEISNGTLQAINKVIEKQKTYNRLLILKLNDDIYFGSDENDYD